MNRLKMSIGVFLLNLLLQPTRGDDTCDESKCPGPTAYYRDIGCKPVYNTPGDCCAYRYDCDKIKSLPTDKCYANGTEYEIGAPLREEDALPCDIGCVCKSGSDGVGSFACEIVDCLNSPPKPGCYRKNSVYECCPGEEICPENPEDRATCEVNGKTYRDGEHFTIEPNTQCVCAPGYTGENVEPFCRSEMNYCRPLFREHSDVVNNCAPVYYSNQAPQTSCSVFSRCQNENDTIIKNEESSSETDDDICHFGTLVMHPGDELNQATDYSSVCVKCVCEVGPTPTCQRLPDEECDVTKHPPTMFDRVVSMGSTIGSKIQKTINQG